MTQPATQPATPLPEAVAPPALRRLLSHWPAALFFLALVAAVNYPLVLNLNSHVVGRPFDDAFEAIWQLSTVHRAVFVTHTNPFFTPDVFYPQGWYLASGAHATWYMTLLAPLTALVGPVAAYNLANLATFVVAALGVYWLVYSLTGQKVVAVLAGCAYIVAPHHTLRLGGHTNILFGMMLLPYALGATWRAMTAETRARRWIVLAGVTLAGVIISHWYFLFIATLPLVAGALGMPSAVAWRARLGRLAALGAVALVAVAPFLALTWHARSVMLPGGGTFALANIDQHGFSPDYLLGPNPLHPLWRARSAGLFPISGEWDIVALGYATVILAAAGLLTTPWRRTRPFVLMGLVSLVLALGPTLRWRGQRVLWPVPARLSEALAPWLRDLSPFPAGRLPVLLPDFALYYLMPFYNSVRVLGRYAMPLTLAVAVLAGFGAAWLWGKGRGGRLLAVALGAVIIFEGLTIPYRDFTPVAANQRAVDSWLAAQPAGTAIIEYPRPWVDKTAMYSQSRHHRSVVNGFMSFEPTFLTEAGPALGEWPNPAALPILRQWGVDYVIVSGLPGVAAFDDGIWPGILAIDGLCPVARFPGAFGFMGFSETHVLAVQSPGEACPAP